MKKFQEMTCIYVFLTIFEIGLVNLHMYIFPLPVRGAMTVI